MIAPAEAYPLAWPAGRPRTSAHKRTRAKFHVQKQVASTYTTRQTWTKREGISLAAAGDMLMGELGRLGAKQVVLSTNLRLRMDGLPASGQRQPDDPGAAAYFLRNGQQLCFACDRWDRVEDNIVAIAKTIEALRGIDRWGTGDMMQAAFTGFQAIEAKSARRAWWVVLGTDSEASGEEVEGRFRQLAHLHHPDKSGSTTVMAEINGAYDDFKRERGIA